MAGSARRRVAGAVLAIAVCAAPGRSRADEHTTLFLGELGLGLAYSSTDLVGLTGYLGVSFGKPVLDVCYVGPMLELEVDLTTGMRATVLLQCNFVPSPGFTLSLGAGAGGGTHAFTDDGGNTVTQAMTFHVVEAGLKFGGTRRFALLGSWVFDQTAGGTDALLLKLALGFAYP